MIGNRATLHRFTFFWLTVIYLHYFQHWELKRWYMFSIHSQENSYTPRMHNFTSSHARLPWLLSQIKPNRSVLNCRHAEPSLRKYYSRENLFPHFKANSSNVKAVRLKDKAFPLYYRTSPSWLVMACASTLWRRECWEGWKSPPGSMVLF